MATSGRGTGIVGYNVQTAVDAKHHLIVAHEVTNSGSDRAQLSSMGKQTQEAMGVEKLTALADRGYFKGEEILECERAGINALVPKPQTSNNKAKGQFDKRDFRYIAADDEYRCPAGQRAIWRFTSIEHGHDAAQVLVLGVSAMPDQSAMHDGRLPAHCALGTRSGAGGDAGSPGEDAGSRAHPPANRRACLRHAQGLDGRHALPDEETAERQHRDESARPGLQPETRDADLRGRAADAGDEGPPLFPPTPPPNTTPRCPGGGPKKNNNTTPAPSPPPPFPGFHKSAGFK